MAQVGSEPYQDILPDRALQIVVLSRPDEIQDGVSIGLGCGPATLPKNFGAMGLNLRELMLGEATPSPSCNGLRNLTQFAHR